MSATSTAPDVSAVLRRVGVLLVMIGLVASVSSGIVDAASKGRSIDDLKQGTVEYSLVQAQSHLAVGTSRFVFGLAGKGGRFLTRGAPQVWVATSMHARAAGPFTARWLTWTAPQDDPTGKPPVPGYFTADVVTPKAGNWYVLAKTQVKGRTAAAVAAMPVKAHPPAEVGTPAISEATPVATTPEEAAKVDTRSPPTPMHYISLDAALKNGLPTVLVFATPLLCTSRMCGPVVDEVLSVYNTVGTQKANFVDVEIYPDRNANKPSPLFLQWGFDSEPWVIVIDKAAIIKARFEGPVVAPEIKAALSPLLSSS
jgi:hypothetical protein